MRVDELDVPDSVADALTSVGFVELHPPQADAIPIALEGRNLVAAIPTASGKSLIGYAAALKTLALKQGSVLYIVPLKALASEKRDDFDVFSERLGFRVHMSTGDLDSDDRGLSDADVVVATSEKADSMIRHGSPWMRDVRLVIADEVHMIHDPGRGPTLEVTLTKMMGRNPDLQIIALSATISNAIDLANWLDADLVILSVGVRPDTALAKAAGLELTAKGCIVVDSHMRTSAPGVYAVGDAVQVTDLVTGQPGFVPLAGPANKQGRIAADNICGIASEYKGTQGSSVLKVFGMTVAMTGVNERAAKAAGLDYDKMYTFNNSHAAYYPGASGISMKVLYEKATGRILGAQLVGFEGVDKRCDVLATAIRTGMTAADLTELELCYAPPYGSAKDPVNYAGYAIENARTGLVRTFHWHDVAALPRDGSVTLLDVRTPAEYAAGHIDGFANLPLDELRQHIGRLDPAKPVFLHCHSGLRSYLACRILAGHGFACYNLTGGYRFYSLVTGETKAAEAPCYPAG